ncbi:fused MFS/spermidine synthase [Phyllobacterium sp. UNC302MFCol5.2]|uniref:fused MFS/spermidine synthase n=1 Tax=Phyllobacterium sp. UNC302MFCol5.2 TaxID=1449065 RepID=UPI0005600C32|nr:fused MFS/spermidine synthase [Phyllobacterium sp. UNC302MFCol5.2]
MSVDTQLSNQPAGAEQFEVSMPQRLTLTAPPALLLFASGFSALVFQVVWVRQLSLIVGVDVYAVTAGVAAFMAGLALGSLLLGPAIDRSNYPFRFYALLEAGVALCGIAVTVALAHFAPSFAIIENSAAPVAWLIVFALVGVPAVLMGGTLPAVVRSVAASNRDIGRKGGRLYAANTAGAIAGTLAAAFLLIPYLGVSSTAYAAAALSFLAAALALVLASPAQAQTISPANVNYRNVRLALFLYSVAGGIALGYEVIWTQSIVQFMSTRTFAFAIVLATYLIGLAAGSALASRWVDRVRDHWSIFGLLIAGAGLVGLCGIAFLGNWIIMLQSMAEYWLLQLTGNQLAGMSARFAVAAILIVLPTTLLLGAAFPFALKLVVEDGRTGSGVGLVSGWNTLGSIVGTVLTGFVLVPTFGFVGSFGILAVAATAIGLIAVFRNVAAVRLHRIAIASVCILTLALAFLVPSDRFASLLPGAQAGRLVFYEEGLGATVAVVEQGRDRKFRRLYIQGVSNTGDSLPSLRYMRLQALLPLITMQKRPQAAMVVGLGTGITAGALLTYDGLNQRVAAELLPGVQRAANLFNGNFNAASSPDLDIRLRDGRRELLGSEESYDLVTLEPPPPSAAGVANLYSTDFYRLAAARLRPGGMVAQWLPLPTQNDEDTRSLVRSFIDVFPHASLWTTELHEMLLVGSFEPMNLDVAQMSARFEQPGVRQALREVGVNSLPELMATFVMDRKGLETYAGDAAPVTDDMPRIEYAAWVRPDTFPTVLPKLLALASEPPLVNADAAFITSTKQEREILHTFYNAGLSAYRGDRDAWQRNAGFVSDHAPDNAYYAWFLGGNTQ